MANTPKKNKGANKGKGVGGNGNLIPAKKGEVRNPKGRPKKGKAWADIANELLGAKEIKFTLLINGKPKKDIHLSTELTMRHIIIASQIEMAINGDVQAARELADRTEGKPMPMTPGQAETIDLTDIADALNNSYEERKPQ